MSSTDDAVQYSTVQYSTHLIHSLYSQIQSSSILLQCLSGIHRPGVQMGGVQRSSIRMT